MNRTPLFTSLPPRVKRLAPDGEDRGPAWTHLCLQSWQRAGFEVVSVNAACEADEVRAAYPGITVSPVQRDGRARTGRPLVYLADLLALMAGCDQPQAALANADVMFTAQAIAGLPGWRAQGFVFSGRIEIDDFQFANPRLHGGVDFVMAETRHLQGLAVPELLFGTPWWDYWLPLAMAGRGVPVAKLQAQGLPVIAHLAHPERWSREDFLANFALFTHALAQQAQGLPPLPAPAGAATGAETMLPMCLAFSRAMSALIHNDNPVLELTGTLAAAA